MTLVVLYDDARARAFEPFASTRPVSEMVSGVALVRERWRLALRADETQFIGGLRHADFDDPGATVVGDVVPAGTIVVNARCSPALPLHSGPMSPREAACSIWKVDDALAAVRIRAAMHISAFVDGSLALDDLYPGTGSIGELDGWWMKDVWDFVRYLPQQLASDIGRYAGLTGGAHGAPQGPPAHTTVLGSHPVYVAWPAAGGEGHTTVIEPHVVFDATDGPIFVGAGSRIRAFTRVTGPCFIGDDVQVMGGDITGCSIGERCKVRGELSSTIMIGHSNKGHDGFVGHSYLGRWVNLGAGTTTSNLKNTYGPVSLWTPEGTRDTGLQFLGTFFGDHVKTGIGLRLTTGTVLGAGANVYGSMPPKAVAPFAWGDAPPYDTYRADKFVETAARVMKRRNIELSAAGRRHLVSVHTSRWSADRGAE